MKKIYALLAMMFVALTSVQAQTPLFAEGDEIVSLGIGIGDSKVYGMPISLSYEKGFKDLNAKSTIGLGGSISYQHKNYNYSGSGLDKYAYSGMTLAVTGTYHYDLVDNFDLFANVSLGYSMGQVTAKIGDRKGSDGTNYFYYGFGVGGRYYFTDDIAAYVKLGLTSTSFLEVGASYRFDVSSLFKK